MKHILAADIGGTHSRFGHFTLHTGELAARSTHVCHTASLHSTDDVLREAAATGLSSARAHICIFAVAGPVWEPDRASPTNVPLTLDFRGRSLHARCINDFAAQTFATLTLPGLQALCVRQGTAYTHAARAVIGAGTGLGMAHLIYDATGHALALPSEGGHAPFAFEGREEMAFAAFVRNALNAPCANIEHVLSGRGLTCLHRFLTGEDLLPAQIATQYLGETSESPHETARWFARFYARACRCLALHTLCRGGLFIAGGIAAKNPTLVQGADFADEFYKAPAHILPLLRDMPVWLMRHEYAGLWGAARAASEIPNVHSDTP